MKQAIFSHLLFASLAFFARAGGSSREASRGGLNGGRSEEVEFLHKSVFTSMTDIMKEVKPIGRRRTGHQLKNQGRITTAVRQNRHGARS